MVVELQQQQQQQQREATERSEIQKTKYVWMNGKIVAWEDGNIPVMTHALQYGTGVFEGIRGYAADGNLLLFRLGDHFERLINSAKIADISSKYSSQELLESCLSLLRANEIREDCYIRPIIFVGFSGLDLGFINYPVEAAIAVFPFKHYFAKAGLDVCVSTWTRLYDPVTPPMAKICGNYVNSVFAKREAMKNGYDEAIMLNANGKISEGSGENIFVVRKGKIFTPGTGASILDGITRNTVIEISRDLGFEVVERDISRSELYVADEVFLTGTAAGVIPVMTIDRRKVGSGNAGHITKELAEAYSALVLGKNTHGHEEWVTRVY